MKSTSDQIAGSRQTTLRFIPHLPPTVNPTPSVTQVPGYLPGQPPVMRVITQQPSMPFVPHVPPAENATRSTVQLSVVPPGQLPVTRVFAHQPPVLTVSTHDDNSSSAAPPPQRVEANPYKQAIVAHAAAFRSAILEGNEQVTRAILASPNINEIAMTVDAEGKNALIHALDKNDLSTLNSLLNLLPASDMALRRFADDRTALDVAAVRGSAIAIQWLLELPSAQSQIMLSIDGGRRRAEGNVFTIAALYGHESVMRLLMASPYATALAESRTSDGNNALALSAMFGREAHIRLMLATPQRSVLVQAKNELGINAMVLSAIHGHESVFLALLECDEVRSQLVNCDAAMNPLTFALINGHVKLANVIRQQTVLNARYRISSAPAATGAPRQ